MTDSKKRGYLLIVYGVLTMMLCHYACYGSFALFMVPIETDLQISRTALTLSTSFASVTGMILAPILGSFLSRHSIRKYMFLGLLVAGGCLALQGSVTSIYQFYILFVLRSIASEFALMLPFSSLAARWFKENQSFATSIIFVGISLGGVVVSPVLAYLIAHQGWRFAYLVYGIVIAAVLAPLCLLIVRDYPEDTAEEKLEEEEEELKGTVPSFKRKSFWLLVLGMCCCSFLCEGMYHLSAFVESLGYDTVVAAFFVSLYNFVCIFAKLVMGRLFDKKGLRAGILFGAVGIVGTFAFMILAILKTSLPILVIAFVLFGIGHACQSIYAPSLIGGIFPAKEFSVIYGRLEFFILLVAAAASPSIAFLYETQGSYLVPWIVLFFVAVAASVFLLLCARQAEKENGKA